MPPSIAETGASIFPFRVRLRVNERSKRRRWQKGEEKRRGEERKKEDKVFVLADIEAPAAVSSQHHTPSILTRVPFRLVAAVVCCLLSVLVVTVQCTNTKYENLLSACV